MCDVRTAISEAHVLLEQWGVGVMGNSAWCRESCSEFSLEVPRWTFDVQCSFFQSAIRIPWPRPL